MKNPYFSRAWKEFTVRYRKSSPLCVSCLCVGRVNYSTLTDHVFPWSSDHSKFWSNVYQALCNKCHGKKKAYELKEQYLYHINDKCFVLTPKDYEYWAQIKNNEMPNSWWNLRLKT